MWYNYKIGISGLDDNSKKNVTGQNNMDLFAVLQTMDYLTL